MFALLVSAPKKKWKIVEVDDDRQVLVDLQGRLERGEHLTDEEKLLDSIFGKLAEYKIVRVEPEE